MLSQLRAVNCSSSALTKPWQAFHHSYHDGTAQLRLLMKGLLKTLAGTKGSRCSHCAACGLAADLRFPCISLSRSVCAQSQVSDHVCRRQVQGSTVRASVPGGSCRRPHPNARCSHHWTSGAGGQGPCLGIRSTQTASWQRSNFALAVRWPGQQARRWKTQSLQKRASCFWCPSVVQDPHKESCDAIIPCFGSNAHVIRHDLGAPADECVADAMCLKPSSDVLHAICEWLALRQVIKCPGCPVMTPGFFRSSCSPDEVT